MRTARKAPSAPQSVESFIASLDHPLKPVVAALRALMLGASPDVREGIKWNAPSFHTTDDFATFNLTAKDRVRIILHSGAKKRDDGARKGVIADPEGLIEWPSADRGVIALRGLDDLAARRDALQAIVRAWIALL